MMEHGAWNMAWIMDHVTFYTNRMSPLPAVSTRSLLSTKANYYYDFAYLEWPQIIHLDRLAYKVIFSHRCRMH